MVSPYQTMVRTSVSWMHYLSLDCSQHGLTGKGKLNMISDGTAFQTCTHMHSTQQLRSDIILVPFLEYCTSYWLCMDARNENLGWLALFSYELNCSINQKNLHCDCKLFRVFPSVHPVAFVRFGFSFSYFFM